MKSELKNTRKLVYTALMCAVTVVCSQLSIPLPYGVPVTLQTFAIALSGFILGGKYSAICYTVYLLLGICGIPVFSGFTSGISRLFEVTGGFLWGFYFLVILASISRNKNRLFVFISSVISVLICHLCGVLQFAYITDTAVWVSFLAVSAPFIIKDILSYIFAYFLAKKINKR